MTTFSKQIGQLLAETVLELVEGDLQEIRSLEKLRLMANQELLKGGPAAAQGRLARALKLQRRKRSVGQEI